MSGAQSSQRYTEVINEVAQYVHDHVASPISLELLAEQVGVSKFHLGRIFHAATGLQLGEFIQRRRLERAYRLLSAGKGTVIEVALNVGYESHSAFSRAFGKAFGLSPSEVRRQEVPTFRLPQLTKEMPRPELIPDLVELQERTLVGLYGKGFSNQSFVELAGELYRSLAHALGLSGGFDDSLQQRVGVSLDSPWGVEQRECRYFAGVVGDCQSAPASLARYRWAAGRWARFEHHGSYQTLWQTVSRIYAGWVVPQGRALKDAAIIQAYVNGVPAVPPHQLRTHLYLALADE